MLSAAILKVENGLFRKWAWLKLVEATMARVPVGLVAVPNILYGISIGWYSPLPQEPSLHTVKVGIEQRTILLPMESGLMLLTLNIIAHLHVFHW
jgi:hypothetical protein